MGQPIVYIWDAQERVMRPLSRYHNVALAQFEDGTEYILSEVKTRSRASHDHYFAVVYEAWAQLPERLAPSFPTAEHLRKWCLIQCGYFEQREIAMDSRQDADRLARYIRIDDHYSRIKIDGDEDGKWIVVIRRAQSQERGKMDAETFQASKTKVLDLLADIIGVNRGTLTKEAGRNA